MRDAELDTLINTVRQSFDTYERGSDKTCLDVRKALEISVCTLLQILQRSLDDDSFVLLDPARTHVQVSEKVVNLFNELAPKLRDIYKTQGVSHLTEPAISSLATMAEIAAANPTTFSPVLSEIISPELLQFRKRVFTPREVENFFDQMLRSNGLDGDMRTDRYRVSLYDKSSTSTEKKEAMVVALKKDAETLRAMLDSESVSKEQITGLVYKHHQKLFASLPSVLLSIILGHSKGIEALKKVNAENKGFTSITIPNRIGSNRWEHRHLVPIPLEVAKHAVEAISKSTYFELSGGVRELEQMITYFYQNIHDLLSVDQERIVYFKNILTARTLKEQVDLLGETKMNDFTPGSYEFKAVQTVLVIRSCAIVLEDRLQEIVVRDRKVLTDLKEFVDKKMGEIKEKQSAGSSFKKQLDDCAWEIEVIFEREDQEEKCDDYCHVDVKIHCIVQALVDAHNAIKSTFKGRSILGMFGSTTAAGFGLLIQAVQKSLEVYPSYTFTLTYLRNEEVEMKWTEEFADTKKLQITDKRRDFDEPKLLC